MPTDPRLNSLVGYVQQSMTGDASAAATAMLRQDLNDARARIAAKEREASVQTGSGAPTQPARDGTLYVDTTASRLYVRTLSAWKSVLLS